MRHKVNGKSVGLLIFIVVGLLGTPVHAQTDSKVAAAQLQRLLNGNARYYSDRARRPNERPNGGAQYPFAALVSCSDARVPPEILFDQGVNNLFVVRVAGNTVDDPAIAHPALIDTVQLQSLDFAVTALNVKLIVVLGHGQCGAVRGAIQKCGQPSIGPMFENICPAVRDTASSSGNPTAQLESTIVANVRRQVNLLRSTPPFAEKVKSGELRIVGALNNIDTGRVTVVVP
jgi:carbonic anhydrase